MMRRAMLLTAGMITLCPTMASSQSFTPQSQLLAWCKSNNPAEFGMCFGYIYATKEVGISDKVIDTFRFADSSVLPNDLIKQVVAAIEAEQRENLSSPAYLTVAKVIRQQKSKQ